MTSLCGSVLAGDGFRGRLPTDRLNVELIDREDALGARDGLLALVAAARGNAFVTPEWYRAALSTLHPGSRPAVVVVRDRGEVRGLLPLLEDRSGGASAPRAFRAPDSATSITRWPSPATTRRSRSRRRPRSPSTSGPAVDLDLGRVDAGGQLVGGAGPGLALADERRLAPEEALPYIELNGATWEGYLAGRSRGFRNQLGRKMRGLREGPRGAGPPVGGGRGGDGRRVDAVQAARRALARARGRFVGGRSPLPATFTHSSCSRRIGEAGFGSTCWRSMRCRSRAGMGGGWATASPIYQAGFDPAWGAAQRRLPAAGRDRSGGDRRGRVRVRPAARR